MHLTSADRGAYLPSGVAVPVSLLFDRDDKSHTLLV